MQKLKSFMYKRAEQNGERGEREREEKERERKREREIQTDKVSVSMHVYIYKCIKKKLKET